ncbi:hypothetical protein DJ79_15970 [Halorubrum ezzemoulense]|uniref:DUF7979 domain-containing protein n=1 Tax=Halorubrum ezzemoulense TaxID=337243 RepID=A0A256J8T5_HALEZ|nr:hypothetical protein [Halorubrum ezzemoulense]OYR65200.1 hypothetical protein DJ79_15970 [Halorubrum ezzemoulense]
MSLRDTGRRLRLRRTGRVPADARVRHYDELDDDEQEIVRELADEPQTAPETGRNPIFPEGMPQYQSLLRHSNAISTV